MELIFLSATAFLAGLVDAAVGGGGLIQLPALFLLLPQPLAASIPAVFGTNKVSSICGTSMAVAQYAFRIHIPWRSMLPAAAAALVFSALGARSVVLIDPALFKPLIVILLCGVALFVWRGKSLGDFHRPSLPPNREVAWAGVIGAAIGFYDGIFGPGTGSFLIFLFVTVLGFDFLHASASAKVINFATNLAAVAYFAWGGWVYWEYALPMGLCNILGAMVGARLAILKGNRFLRHFYLAIVTLLILRLGFSLLNQ